MRKLQQLTLWGLVSLTVVCVTCTPCGRVQAAGAELPFVSIGSLGSANSNAAETRDASALYFNPANMARLRRSEVQLSQSGGLSINTGTVYNDTSNQGGTQGISSFGSPPQSSDGVYAIGSQSSRFLPKAVALGSLFLTTSNHAHYTVGFGVFSQAGGRLNYADGWFGQYFIQRARFETVTFNPAFSARINERHSVGFGISLVAAHLKAFAPVDVQGTAPYVTNSVLSDANGAQLAGLSGLLPPQLASLLQGAQLGNVGYDNLPDSSKGVIANTLATSVVAPDSTVTTKTSMTGYGFGYNLGYLFERDDSERWSIAYRSDSEVRMKGRFYWDFQNLRSTTPGQDSLLFNGQTLGQYIKTNYHPDSEVALGLRIPAKITLGYFRQLTPRLDVMSNLQWNRTSAIRQQCLIFGPVDGGVDGTVRQGPQCVSLNFRDSVTGSVGVQVRQFQRFMWRAGVQFDQTPISSAQFRSATVPDNNRWLFGVGGSLFMSPSTSVDLAYGYLKVQDGRSDYRDPCRNSYYEGSPSSANNCSSNGGNYRAQYRGIHSHVVGLQLNSRF